MATLRSISLFAISLATALLPAQEPSPYEITDVLTASTVSNSRSKEWKPSEGIVMEVSGMDFLPDGRLAVSLRKGELWLVDGLDSADASKVTFSQFASGLHEPLGVHADGKDLLVGQRSEITRLRDLDGDGRADEYLSEASGWNVSGSYHGYAYGPEPDGLGSLWVALNLDMGEIDQNDKPWRGWALRFEPGVGKLIPVAAGLRSPCGLGANRAGDMFVSDQEGTWIPTTPIHHLRRGAFFGNPEGVASQDLPGSPLKLSAAVPSKVPYPEALELLPELVPPACWLPYNKMGRSATDIQLIDCDGKFGPFDGQLLVGEFTNAGIHRVALEKIGGEYQGACFPFRYGFASAVLRLAFDKDGALYVGCSNRGWASLGARAYGLQRVRWNGVTPFEIREMKARPDGFDLHFTLPVDPATASDPASYSMESYTYLYSSAYGGEPIQHERLAIRKATPSADGKSVRLEIDGLREVHVHELRAEGLRSATGKSLVHPDAYYTLNRIPSE